MPYNTVENNYKNNKMMQIKEEIANLTNTINQLQVAKNALSCAIVAKKKGIAAYDPNATTMNHTTPENHQKRIKWVEEKTQELKAFDDELKILRKQLKTLKKQLETHPIFTGRVVDDNGMAHFTEPDENFVKLVVKRNALVNKLIKSGQLSEGSPQAATFIRPTVAHTNKNCLDVAHIPKT